MSLPMAITNRPFATDILTGMMLPDGFFEASLGLQRINAHFGNMGATPATDINVSFESVSSLAITVVPQTYSIPSLLNGAARLLTWDIDVSAALPGEYEVSFIAENASGRTRMIRKIFVTRVQYNPSAKAFTVHAPQGSLEVRSMSMYGPSKPCPDKQHIADVDYIALAGEFLRKNPDPTLLKGCLPFYLLREAEITLNYTSAFSGQYGDLPYQDPWWKTLLAILSAVLGVTAVALAGAVTLGGADVGIAITAKCCSSSEVAEAAFLGLGVGSISSGFLAATQDVRDPFRRGQDHTQPALGELTKVEQLRLSLSYPQSLTLGTPFAVQTNWEYTRITSGASYNYSVSETNENIHVLSNYQITAPNVAHVGAEHPFIVKGEFLGPDNKALQGDQLFVRCVLEGQEALQGQFIQFFMQDDGNAPDEKPNDGIYSGEYHFEEKDLGFWKIYVIAQDVNNAQPNMPPEQAAQIIGGMVRTHQLTISFQGGTCPFVPDGEVHVII